MPAYAPYAPLDTLKTVAEDVWIIDGPEIAMDYVGLKLQFPTRATIVRLPDGRLWVHSPTQADEALFSAIEALGPVGFLIAPNTLHYWWISDWSARFPQAEVWGVPGLDRSARRALPPYRRLSDEAPASWGEGFDLVLVTGDLLSEADVFHRPSRTLILTDLIENFEPQRIKNGWLRRTVQWSGAADPDGKAPIDMQLSFLRRRRRLRAAVRRMIAWDPERVVIAHGRWYPHDGAKELERAFRWVL